GAQVAPPGAGPPVGGERARQRLEGGAGGEPRPPAGGTWGGEEVLEPLLVEAGADGVTELVEVPAGLGELLLQPVLAAGGAGVGGDLGGDVGVARGEMPVAGLLGDDLVD